MDLREIQEKIKSIYFHHDIKRGIAPSFMWLIEEIGELSKEIQECPEDQQRLEEEMSDVFIWILTLCNLLGLDLDQCIQRYMNGCPRCKKEKCEC